MARLDDCLHRQRLAVERGDGTRFFEHDLAFHEILLSALGYERVKAVVEAARGSLDRTRLFLLRTPERQAKSYLEHRAIVDALRARDPDAAQRAMKHHLDNSMDEIERRAAESPEIFMPAAGAA
jgi:DNA-binding GntR family transcriptional regulator